MIDQLKEKKLNIDVLEKSNSGCTLSFDVWAKPGAKVEKIFISKEGNLTIQTRSKPIEGEANSAIIEAVAKVFGTPKSNVQIIRGEKNRQKRIMLLLEITVSKQIDFYLNKLSAILVQEA